ncbi:MAG TPA: hypothetical protein VFH76_23920 [Kribbella sp.]|nr:hypothetical protein [Kribbella sp.]
MDWARRQPGALLGLGLSGGLVWTTVVGLSMPSWFEPAESCARKFPDISDVSEIRTSWFPPSASCVYGDEVREYLSTTRSVILAVVGVLLLGLIVIGLILTLRRLRGGDRSIRTADGADLARRRSSHLAYGALGMGLALGVLTVAGWVAIVFGALPGTVVFAVAAPAGLSAFGTQLDRRLGPLTSTARDSRRRGTIAGLTTFATALAANVVLFWGYIPLSWLWSVLLGAIAFAIVAATQWSRVATS